jgi:hypothetical protein
LKIYKNNLELEDIDRINLNEFKSIPKENKMKKVVKNTRSKVDSFLDQLGQKTSPFLFELQGTFFLVLTGKQ